MTEPTRIDETAIVGKGAQIGAGTAIWHWTHVRGGARIGRDCTLGQNVYVAPTAVIGDGVKIQNNVSIYDGVTLEDHVFCGPSAVFTNVKIPRSEVDRSGEFLSTHVKRGATIGANATILCGITLGEYAFVAAGSVVTDDVAPYRLMIGNPARPVGWSCRCGARLEAPNPVIICGECGAQFEIEDGVLRPTEKPQ